MIMRLKPFGFKEPVKFIPVRARNIKEPNTSRREDIIQMMKEGLNNSEIAEELGITRHDVYHTLARIGIKNTNKKKSKS